MLGLDINSSHTNLHVVAVRIGVTILSEQTRRLVPPYARLHVDTDPSLHHTYAYVSCHAMLLIYTRKHCEPTHVSPKIFAVSAAAVRAMAVSTHTHTHKCTRSPCMMNRALLNQTYSRTHHRSLNPRPPTPARLSLTPPMNQACLHGTMPAAQWTSLRN